VCKEGGAWRRPTTPFLTEDSVNPYTHAVPLYRRCVLLEYLYLLQQLLEFHTLPDIFFWSCTHCYDILNTELQLTENSSCLLQLCFITSLQAEKLIAPFSDSAALSLRELLSKLKNHDNEHEQTASVRTCDVSESSSSYDELQEQRHKSEFPEYVGLGSRNAASVSWDNLSASSDLGHSLRKDKVRCNIIKRM
jgi:hypothetical protein